LPLGCPASTSSRTCPTRSRRAARSVHLFLRQQLVGTGAGQRFGFQLLHLGALVGAEVARVAAQDAAVELDDARGHGVDEGAVVRHHHQRAAPAGQQGLQPLDRVHVEVVGRLVQQQHIGPRHQRLGQRHAFLLAARQPVDHRVGRQLQALQGLGDALLPGPAVQRL
jgi:hypothetical protein